MRRDNRAAAVAMRTSAVEAGASTDEARERLAALLESRRSYWVGQLDAPPARSDFDMMFREPRAGLVTRSYRLDLVLFWGVVIVAALLPRAVAGPLLITLAVGLPVWVLIRLVREQSAGGAHPRLSRALAELACPVCGYDLAGVDPLGTLASHGSAAGPEACPECGSAWPLVPAPTPEEVRAHQYVT